MYLCCCSDCSVGQVLVGGGVITSRLGSPWLCCLIVHRTPTQEPHRSNSRLLTTYSHSRVRWMHLKWFRRYTIVCFRSCFIDFQLIASHTKRKWIVRSLHWLLELLLWCLLFTERRSIVVIGSCMRGIIRKTGRSWTFLSTRETETKILAIGDRRRTGLAWLNGVDWWQLGVGVLGAFVGGIFIWPARGFFSSRSLRKVIGFDRSCAQRMLKQSSCRNSVTICGRRVASCARDQLGQCEKETEDRYPSYSLSEGLRTHFDRPDRLV